MATLKSTSSLDSVAVITNDDMNKALQENLYAQRINLVGELVLDIESICHDCFHGGLNQIDHQIVHRCKQLLGETLNALGLFNVFLYTDTEAAINAAILKDDKANAHPKQSNRFIQLDKHPRVKLGFNPRGKTSFDELDEDLIASNNSVSESITRINKILSTVEPTLASDVRRKYAELDDGYLISISFTDLSSSQEVLDRISSFIKTIESLSLDELMISQQFSNWFKVAQANPFDLEASDFNSLPQTILISVFNLGGFTSSFYVSTILHNIKILLTQELDTNKIISVSKSSESINSSYLRINLAFKD